MLSRNAAGWYFTFDGMTVGYYDTKPEAMDAHRGLERFDKFENNRAYFTCEPATTEKVMRCET